MGPNLNYTHVRSSCQIPKGFGVQGSGTLQLQVSRLYNKRFMCSTLLSATRWGSKLLDRVSKPLATTTPPPPPDPARTLRCDNKVTCSRYDLCYKTLVDKSFPQVSHCVMHGCWSVLCCSKELSFLVQCELDKNHSTA